MLCSVVVGVDGLIDFFLSTIFSRPEHMTLCGVVVGGEVLIVFF